MQKPGRKNELPGNGESRYPQNAREIMLGDSCPVNVQIVACSGFPLLAITAG